MQIQPLADRVVVKLLGAEQVSKSGIIIPDTAKEKSQEGEVVAVGPGKINKEGKRVSVELKVGERVLFKNWGGDDYKADGIEYKIMSEDDVLAIIKTK